MFAMQKVGVVIEIIRLQDKKEQKKYIFTQDQVNCGIHCQWIVQRPKAQADSGAYYKNFIRKKQNLRLNTKMWT